MSESMSDTEKTLRLKILQAKLRRAEMQEEEAELEQLQRALALQDQEEEVEFNRKRRETQRQKDETNVQCERNWKRPSIFLGTEVYFDDDVKYWVCQYGYVFACGETPAMACDNFDHLWMFGR